MALVKRNAALGIKNACAIAKGGNVLKVYMPLEARVLRALDFRSIGRWERGGSGLVWSYLRLKTSNHIVSVHAGDGYPDPLHPGKSINAPSSYFTLPLKLN